MYNDTMTHTEITKILLTYYKPSTMYNIMRGIRRPIFDNMVDMNEKHDIPYQAWINLPTWLASQEKEKGERTDCEDDSQKSDINCEKNNSQAS